MLGHHISNSITDVLPLYWTPVSFALKTAFALGSSLSRPLRHFFVPFRPANSPFFLSSMSKINFHFIIIPFNQTVYPRFYRPVIADTSLG